MYFNPSDKRQSSLSCDCDTCIKRAQHRVAPPSIAIQNGFWARVKLKCQNSSDPARCICLRLYQTPLCIFYSLKLAWKTIPFKLFFICKTNVKELGTYLPLYYSLEQYKVSNKILRIQNTKMGVSLSSVGLKCRAPYISQTNDAAGYVSVHSINISKRCITFQYIPGLI